MVLLKHHTKLITLFKKNTVRNCHLELLIKIIITKQTVNVSMFKLPTMKTMERWLAPQSIGFKLVQQPLASIG